MSKIFLHLIIFCILFTSCKKDDLTVSDDSLQIENPEKEVSENENPSEDPVSNVNTRNADEFASNNFGANVQANFIGRVIDKDGQPIGDVLVRVGGKEVLTDLNGVFVVNSATVNKKFAYVKVSKEGYIPGSRALVPTTNKSNEIRITLLDKNVVATINSGENTTVELSDGVKASFQGNFIYPDGTDYTGSVEVSMHYLPPNDLDTFNEMPGSLLGSLPNNEAVLLETYGMLGVNLYSPSGESLNLAPDSPATLEFPVDQSQLAIAPDTIPLWYFDDELGYWIQEGEAIKTNGKYIAEVAHFSFWNCDDFDMSAELCINVYDENGIPISNQLISLRRANTNFSGTGITDGQGLVCGVVPKDEMLNLVIHFPGCEEQSQQMSIGPFTNDTTIDVNYVISEIAQTKITGTMINCDSESSVENGYVLFEGGDLSSVYTMNNGSFEFTHYFCTNSNQQGSIIGYDYVNKYETEKLTFDYEVSNTVLGEISGCTTSTDTGEDDKVYNGSITLSNQTEVDDFGALGYTKITGELKIEKSGTTDFITNLNALQSLVVVKGDLIIRYNGSLTTFFGLQNLQRVEGSLLIVSNWQLNDITALHNLHTIGEDLAFVANKKAINMDGLQKITVINGNLDICINNIQENLEGLNNLTSIGGNFNLGSCIDYGRLTDENPAMTKTNALANLKSVGGNIRVHGLPVANDFSGFDSLETVGGRFTITFEDAVTGVLNELNKLRTVGGYLHISADFVTEIGGFEELTTVESFDVFGVNSRETKLISGFNKLETGSVKLELITKLETISGFQSLVNSESVNISRNAMLQSITGFNKLKSINSNFSLGGNPLLTDISGFSALEDVNIFFNLYDNPRIASLSSFSSLERVGYRFLIRGMDDLLDFTGLENLTEIGGQLKVDSNDSLTNLVGLDNLTTIGGDLEINDNMNLLSLEGLESLMNVDSHIRIGYEYVSGASRILSGPNVNLSDFCALQNLFINGTHGGDVDIDNNSFNPSVYYIQIGNCSR